MQKKSYELTRAEFCLIFTPINQNILYHTLPSHDLHFNVLTPPFTSAENLASSELEKALELKSFNKCYQIL